MKYTFPKPVSREATWFIVGPNLKWYIQRKGEKIIQEYNYYSAQIAANCVVWSVNALSSPPPVFAAGEVKQGFVNEKCSCRAKAMWQTTVKKMFFFCQIADKVLWVSGLPKGLGERGGGAFFLLSLLTSPYPQKHLILRIAAKILRPRQLSPTWLGFVYSQPIKKPSFSFYLGIWCSQ